MVFQRLNLLHVFIHPPPNAHTLYAIMMDTKTQTFWHLARSNGVCPAAGLLRGLNAPLSDDIDMNWTCWTMSSGSCLLASFFSLSSSSSEEDKLRKRGSSFSIRLSAPKTEDKGDDSSNKASISLNQNLTYSLIIGSEYDDLDFNWLFNSYVIPMNVTH